MSKYIVALTPLGKYFFGGDMTFKVANNEKHNERYSSYVIQSSLFPQQTSLLGMMRFLLLSNSEKAFDRKSQKITSAVEAEKLIGIQSFAITKEYVSNDFKKIINISPCFLEVLENDQWTTLLPAPKDYGYGVSFKNSVNISFNGKQGIAPILSGYDPKDWKIAMYIGTEKSVKASDIFIEDTRIGIEKRYDGKTENNDSSYYKQICYRLGGNEKGKQFRFAFEIEVDDNILLDVSPYQHSIINMGGDSSQFVFEARIPSDNKRFYSESYNDEKEFDSDHKVILLSDSYLQRAEAENTLYAITNTLPFRFLQTTVNTENYTILSSRNLRSDDKFYLYQKGSVFFCNSDQLAALKAALEKPCFKQIGYNHYQVITKK